MRPDILIIAGSFGSHYDMAEIIKKLPEDFPVPILLLRHVPCNVSEQYWTAMENHTGRKITDISRVNELSDGHVFKAIPFNNYSLLKNNGSLTPFIVSRKSHFNPSLDILLESLDKDIIPMLIVMSGLEGDGVKGCAKIAKRARIYAPKDAEGMASAILPIFGVVPCDKKDLIKEIIANFY